MQADARAGRIIHAHNYHALTFLAAAAAAEGQLVLTPHYHGVGRTRLRTAAHMAYKPAGARALRRAARVVAVSEAEADLLAAHFGPDIAARTTLIPNGVEPRSGLPRSLSSPTVFAWGRLEQYKNIDTLIRAVATLPDVDLVVAGEGPASQRLSQLVDQLNAADRIRLVGYIGEDELSRWLASDVLCAATSNVEAYGLTVAEALAAGRPVVATALPAHRSVVASAHLADSSQVTFVTAPPSVPELANAIRSALATTTTFAPSAALPTWTQVAAAVSLVYDQVSTGTAGHLPLRQPPMRRATG